MRALYFMLLLSFLGACNPSNNQQEIKLFVENWSKDILAANADVVRKYYQPQFVIPKVLLERPDGTNISFDVEHAQFGSLQNDSIQVSIPFQVSSTNGFQDQGIVTLDIYKSKSGNFLIVQMTQELAVAIKQYGQVLEQQNNPEPEALSDSVLQKTIDTLSTLFDRVVFFADAGELHLFYVVNGNWQHPYLYGTQRDKGEYKVGVVTADIKTIVPVEFDKVYNPNGSFDGMIEVEKDGLRGLYHMEGGVFLECTYESIYPVTLPDVLAQVKKDDRFGWVDSNGKVSFHPVSHSNKNLFQSPVTNNSIVNWQFSFPGTVTVLENLEEDQRGFGVIVYPSYLRDLGITPIANGSVMLASGEYGMGMTDNQIKVEEIESVSDKFFALVGLFMESGADARGYQTTRNDLVVVNEKAEVLSDLKGLIEDEGGQNPCEVSPEYKTVDKGFYEAKDNMGNYRYYKVTGEGDIEKLESVREFAFTKFVKIDESYFDDCRYDNIYYEGDWREDQPNLVIIRGLSSEELDIMRNEIFAEYGFIFKSEKWKNYFAAKSWYNPQYENVDQFMSETDKYNVKFIREYQQRNAKKEAERDSIQYGWAG